MVKAYIADTTFFSAMQNLDRLDRDRYPDPVGTDTAGLGQKFAKYVIPGRLSPPKGSTRHTAARSGSTSRRPRTPLAPRLLDVRAYTLVDDPNHARWAISGSMIFSATSRTYQLDDFVAFYRTNLNILGLATDDNIQEMATLSRFIYGLSSAYLMSGDLRFYMAAKAGVEFQRDAFRSLSADGRFCFWAYGGAGEIRHEPHHPI